MNETRQSLLLLAQTGEESFTPDRRNDYHLDAIIRPWQGSADGRPKHASVRHMPKQVSQQKRMLTRTVAVLRSVPLGNPDEMKSNALPMRVSKRGRERAGDQG